MDRRTFLASAALAGSAAGCLRSALPGDGSPPRPWSPSEPVERPDGSHDLHVENHTDTTETAWLRVVRPDGATVVDGRYELPDGRGIEFESVAAWERRYTVELALDGTDVRSFEWETRDCGAGSESAGDGGSRNAFLRLGDDDTGDDRLSFDVDECDGLVGPSVPTGPADAFRLDDGTPASRG